MRIHVPDEWALEIINESELKMLKELSKEEQNHEVSIKGQD